MRTPSASGCTCLAPMSIATLHRYRLLPRPAAAVRPVVLSTSVIIVLTSCRGGHIVGFQVTGQVDEHLVDGVDMDVLRRDILEIDVVHLGAAPDVMGHARRGNNIVHRQRWVLRQLPGKAGTARQCTAGRVLSAPSIDQGHLLHHLKQARAAGEAAGFQAGRDRQADGLFGAGGIGHHQIGGKGVQSPLDTLHRGVEGFQVDGRVNALLCVFLHRYAPFPAHGLSAFYHIPFPGKRQRGKGRLPADCGAGRFSGTARGVSF